MSQKKRLLCSQIPSPGASTGLSDSEAYHATRVLRLRDGERVQAIDGRGHTCWAILRTFGLDGRTRVEFAEDVLPSLVQGQESGTLERSQGQIELVPVTLEVAVLKGPAMDWLIEKAVELGVTELVPLLTLRSVVQMDRKSPQQFLERWNKIAVQSLKQCGRLHQLKILEPLSFESYFGQSLSPTAVRFWCDEEQSGNVLSLMTEVHRGLSVGKTQMHLSVGPEGGWDPRERQMLAQHAVRVSLGPLVMRAETASIFSASVVSALLRENRREEDTHENTHDTIASGA